ncbi:colon cancer-associated protein Mic1 [Aphelenchoides avenae]|nr:colon cancer-associated protein Mic1 [Aphelenchus avenae]
MWVVFVPNFIVDVKDGLFMTLELDVEEACNLIVDKTNLVSFLMNRTNARNVLLKTLRKLIVLKALRIGQVATILQNILADNATVTSSSSYKGKYLSKMQYVKPFAPMKIKLDKIVQSVFLEQADDAAEVDKVYLSNILLEFFLVVKKSKIKMLSDQFLPELVLKYLIEAKQFSKLQQLLQYRVIDDSKFLAFELVSNGKVHPPLVQLGIDMLSRRENTEQIAQVLIEQRHVVEAAR